MRDIYLHIGYPKCMSTALQRGFFELHPDISFGGVGVKDNISYANPDIEELFEIILKYSSSAYYKKKGSILNQGISKFIEESKGNILFSNENLSINFSLQGIPSFIKYERLLEVFKGHKIKIIALKRKPIEIIKGVYKEYVRMGYDQTYENYLKWLIILRDRNFLGDIAFQYKHKELARYFGAENILWVDYNKHGNPSNSSKYVTEVICDYMNIKFTKDYLLKKTNQSLSDCEIEQLVEINSSCKREMGLRTTEPFEKHRSRILFYSSGLRIPEKEVFSNVLKKRKALELLSKDNSYVRKGQSEKTIELEGRIERIIEDYNKL